MNPIFQNVRVGKKYFLRNYGESFRFLVIRKVGEDNFVVKHLTTLELAHIGDFIQYGKGQDFVIEEIYD